MHVAALLLWVAMSIERPAATPERSPVPDQSGEPRVDRPSGPTERSRIESKLDALERRALSDDRPQPADRRTAVEPETRLSPLERKLALLDDATRDDPAGDVGRDATARKRDGSDGPERLGWKLTRIWRDSLPTTDGRAFYEKSDVEMRTTAAEARPAPGQYTADLHGTPSEFRVGRTRLDARQLSALIRADENWRGRPVRLVSCETGQGDDPVAQKVADELGVTVTAPTELAFNDERGNVVTTSRRRNEFGILVATRPHDGHWIDFHPTTKGDGNAPDYR
ncbi:hypothetical protein FF36_00858 [Frankia torreyi]|uniref:Uncharacterized protein n=1 Tax=Frankia torreyi TaxID=1856 RepID=A0A0D8BL48_9ACTN|nr:MULTISPECIES: hypothetical protein [Frankia]KJE24851.1 hypothetical protein FF36_00858 [Frankia torreyi]